MELKQQNNDQAIDVGQWGADDEFVVYPEGARDKSRVICPDPAEHGFLIAGHQYMFKHSRDWCPEQYWVEILAYRLGALIGVSVPPAFAAYDADNGTSGALIEWFYRSQGEIGERYVHGGDYMQRMIQGYDRRKGKQHSFETVSTLCKALKIHAGLAGNWIEYWAKVFTFDALIGNTDRHHDNWGVVFWHTPEDETPHSRMSPAFDNGTSMGHEIQARRFSGFNNPSRMNRYILKGTHHMKWRANNVKRLNHVEFLLAFCEKFPEARAWMLGCLDIDADVLDTTVMELTGFSVPVPLTVERAQFMCNLLKYRQKIIYARLGDSA